MSASESLKSYLTVFRAGAGGADALSGEPSADGRASEVLSIAASGLTRKNTENTREIAASAAIKTGLRWAFASLLERFSSNRLFFLEIPLANREI